MSSMNINLVELANANPPPFDTQEPLKVFDDLGNELILCETATIESGATVPLDKVVGFDRPDAYGLNWYWLLRKPKKDTSADALKRNPEFYLDADHPKDMHFTEVNGEYYQTGEGKHRTVIAKYLAHFNPAHYPNGPVIYNVTVYRYEVDHRLMERFRRAKRELEKKGLNHISLRWVPTHQGRGTGKFHLYNPNREYREGYTYSKADFHELEELISRSSLYNRWLGGDRQCYLR